MIPFYTIRTSVLHKAKLDLREYAICQILFIRGGSQTFGVGKNYTEISYPELGESIRVSSRSAIRICNRLVAKGFIETNPKDKLQKRVTRKWENLVLSAEKRGDETSRVGGDETSRGGDETSRVGGDETSRVGGDETSPTLYKDINKRPLEITKGKIKEDLIHSYSNEEEKTTPLFPPPPPKKEKEFSAGMMAQRAYEKARENFQKQNGLQPDVFSWDAQSLRDLEKITVRLKEKMRVNGRTWDHDKDFCQTYLTPFFDAAANTNFWFNKIFSIGVMANRFSDSYDEIIIQKNGSTKSNKTGSQGKELISAEDATIATSNVIARMRAKRAMQS